MIEPASRIIGVILSECTKDRGNQEGLGGRSRLHEAQGAQIMDTKQD